MFGYPCHTVNFFREECMPISFTIMYPGQRIITYDRWSISISENIFKKIKYLRSEILSNELKFTWVVKLDLN